MKSLRGVIGFLAVIGMTGMLAACQQGGQTPEEQRATDLERPSAQQPMGGDSRQPMTQPRGQ